MGRNAGWIALHTGMTAAGAHAILIPSIPLNRSEMGVGQFRPAPWERSRFRCRGRIALEEMTKAHSHKGLDAVKRKLIGNASRYGSRRPSHIRALGQRGRPARSRHRLGEHRSHHRPKLVPVQRYEEAAFLFG
nr:hypothetical protein GCM10017611_11260 [Rhodococcus wratislaviensis]